MLKIFGCHVPVLGTKMTNFLILTSLVRTEQANLAVSRQLINLRDAILQILVVRSFEILFPTGDPDINICSTQLFF